MLVIDKLKIHLPAQMRNRADIIARLVAQELTSTSQKSEITISELRTPAVQVHSSFTDNQIARCISTEIQTQINQLSVESC
ncbi:hypothetical protein CEE37_12245 [candidate division LCP-89 bacterium B3_LCP]|uniref:Uncharacterized protein n=1 Tax=candidate division LCP-89 bacterium B3_LCP TaxID=2012998 RepID=A0A532UUD6_UNCL8|nr:MAG: hypothetical protein CEE37_12245 [candidate division LCP-89 bacterium B3_LCP]